MAKGVVKIIVAGGYEKPYYIKKYGRSEKGAFIRIGNASEPMPMRQIELLFAKRTRHSIGKIKSPKSELKFEQLHIYYQSAGKILNEQLAPNLELLRSKEASFIHFYIGEKYKLQVYYDIHGN